MAESGCLRDVAVQNLQVVGKADLSGVSLTHKVPIKTITADTTLLASESGSIVYITDLDAAITLPTAEAGLNFTFVMGGLMAGGTVTTGTGDCFFGNVTLVSTTADKLSSDEIVVAGGTVGDSDVATLDGDAATSGGNAGDILTCIAVDVTHWLLSGTLTTTHDTPAAVAILG
jgi:hypothetical protein